MKLVNNLTVDNVIKHYEEKYNRKYYGERRNLLISGYEKGYDISLYANPEYDFTQLHLIYDGFEQGLNVKLYAKKCMDTHQMEEVKIGLEHDVDAKLYAKVKFDWPHMRAIRLCLERNLDVSKLLDASLRYWEVCRIAQQMSPDLTDDKLWCG